MRILVTPCAAIAGLSSALEGAAGGSALAVPAPLTRLLAPAFVALVLFIAIALGETLERLVFSASLGLGALQLSIFALGVAHAFRPAALSGLLLLLLVAFAMPIGHVARSLGRWVVSLKWSARPRSVQIALAALVLALLLRLPSTMAPPTDFDGLWYHLAAPKRWLDSGYLRYLPTLNMTLWPMGTEMLYALGLVWSDSAPKLMHFAHGLLLLPAIYALGRRVQGPMLGLIVAIAVVLVVPGMPLSVAYIDCSVSFHFVCAVLAFTVWLRTRVDRWLWVTALCAGVAASCKLTAAPLGPVIALAAAYEMRRDGRANGVIFRQVVLIGLLSVLPFAPFVLRAAVLTGNPFYPFLADLIPTRDWNGAAGKALDQFIKYANWGQSRDISLPTRRIIHHAACAVALLGTAVAVTRFRDPVVRVLVVVTGVILTIFLWSSGPYLRYLLPVVAVLAVLIVVPFGRWLSAPLAGCVAAALAIFAAVQSARTVSRDDLQVLLGTLSRDTYLTTRIPFFPLWQYVNAHLAKDAKVLTTMPANFYIDRTTYIADPLRDHFIHYDTWETFTSDVQRHGICYVIARDPARTSNGPGEARDLLSYPPDRNGPLFVRRLLTESGRELARAGDSALYALDHPSCRATARN